MNSYIALAETLELSHLTVLSSLNVQNAGRDHKFAITKRASAGQPWRTVAERNRSAANA